MAAAICGVRSKAERWLRAFSGTAAILRERALGVVYLDEIAAIFLQRFADSQRARDLAAAIVRDLEPLGSEQRLRNEWARSQKS